MPSEGPLPPSAAANESSAGDVAWNNPSEALASDDVYATRTLFSGQTTQYLELTGFGFSIPGGAPISGIVVEVERSDGGVSTVKDHTVQLLKGGAAAGDNKATGATWPGSDATATYGGASDLWGESWTDSDVNASNFGVRIRAQCTSGNGAPRVDLVAVTVYYGAAWAEAEFPCVVASQPGRRRVEVVGY